MGSHAVEVGGVDGRWSVEVTAAAAEGVVVRTGPLRVGVDVSDAVREVLASAQALNAAALEAWEVVTSGRSTVERLAELAAVDLPEPVRAAAVELLAPVQGE